MSPPRVGDLDKHDIKFSLDMLLKYIDYLEDEEELWGNPHLLNMGKHINNLAEITGVELDRRDDLTDG